MRGGQQRLDAESETLIPTIGGGFDVTRTLRGEGFDANEDGTGRGTPVVPVTGVKYANYSHAYAHDRITDPSGVNPALTKEAHASGNLNVAVPVAFPANLSGTQHASAENLAPAMGGANPTAVAQAMQVRRLTPVECERLQGYPDGYTAIPWRKKPADQCPDGPRYKALGNSWAVPVVRWIGARIDAAVRQA